MSECATDIAASAADTGETAGAAAATAEGKTAAAATGIAAAGTADAAAACKASSSAPRSAQAYLSGMWSRKRSMPTVMRVSASRRDHRGV